MTSIDLSKRLLRNSIVPAIAILTLATAAFAQGTAATNKDAKANVHVHIKNFGQMDARFYRGAQPAKDDYKDLAALGIKTIIDLREDPEAYERPLAESFGMRYVNIPMVGKKYPTAEATAAFLKTVSDPATGKFFVHCAGGRHRTGAMGAVYRYKFYGWTFDQVYKEMKQYDFYTSWGHKAFKDFVEDYYTQNQFNQTGKSAGVESNSDKHSAGQTRAQ